MKPVDHDFSSAALFRPEDHPAFRGFDPADPALVFDPDARGYSPTNAWWLACASHLAYHPEADIAARLEALGLALARFWSHRGTDGYLARGERFAVLAFRGSELADFLHAVRNLGFWRRRTEGGERVHAGFLRALEMVWDEVAPELERLRGLPVFFTGHSLGAALATLAATRHAPRALYTYGSPLVGDRSLVKSLDSVPAFRCVNAADLVCSRLAQVFGYRPVGELIFFTDRGARLHEPDGATFWRRRRGASLRYFLSLRWTGPGRLFWRAMADHAAVNYAATLWHDLRQAPSR